MITFYKQALARGMSPCGAYIVARMTHAGFCDLNLLPSEWPPRWFAGRGGRT